MSPGGERWNYRFLEAGGRTFVQSEVHFLKIFSYKFEPSMQFITNLRDIQRYLGSGQHRGDPQVHKKQYFQKSGTVKENLFL